MAGAPWVETGIVFTSLKGGGAPRRHSCATLLLVQGVSPRVVMDVLGHSQIGLTMNTYSHVVPELRREAADQMHHLLQDREHER